MCPKSPEQFEVVRKQSRRLILDAALRLFGNEGYHAVSVSRIASEANVSKGLMYNYFSSKEDLLRGIITDAMERSESEFAWPAEASPKEQLKVTIDYVFFCSSTAQNDASIVDGFNHSNARIRVHTRNCLGKTEPI